jgi:8-oxo-dGTP pyrophosphatase MutT (NUDIX family)
MEPREPAPARPSASLVIGRDSAAGWEIFMARRHSGTAFAGGALVFPGGALEAQDEAGAGDWLEAHRLAAIRETFEEVGILYARQASGAWPEPGLLAELAAQRGRLASGELRFADLLAGHGLRPATEALIPFAHWVTPPERPKRFDTRFFLAALPPFQDGAHDGTELVDSFWAAPARVVAWGAAGTHLVMRATEVNCRRLAGYPSCGAAIADFAAHPESLVRPTYFSAAGVRYLSVPAAGNRGVCTLLARAAGGSTG